LAHAPQPLNGILTHALEQLPGEVLARLNQDLTALIDHMGAVNAQDAQKPLSDI
jgi:hypothetical protein